MQRYFHSFKNIYSDSINISNCAFVVGPSMSGKSWFLRYNMNKFQSSPIKPLIFHFDLKTYGGFYNFNSFLSSFEKMIMKTINDRN